MCINVCYNFSRGIDIDNVISNFNDALLLEYVKHDKILGNHGIINSDAKNIRNGMFDWNEDEEISFYHNNIENIAKNFGLIKDAKYYINKLKDNGYNDYIIGIQNERVIWDIAVIAYLINKSWFKSKIVSCPNINDDTSYELSKSNNKITFIKKINKNLVYQDLFMKLKQIKTNEENHK